ncbi:gem-associated protein 8-like isoform X2 [Dreissena polymorpha]|uniref:gem-associated protein 8-like isoform X2 n=1 Tax=Dreissena polymorpha TaxID=45954 RepID=UPI00226425CF|nr:gem-associated protein 8-like isoform X2 [Dreissena polymorpha]
MLATEQEMMSSSDLDLTSQTEGEDDAEHSSEADMENARLSSNCMISNIINPQEFTNQMSFMRPCNGNASVELTEVSDLDNGTSIVTSESDSQENVKPTSSNSPLRFLERINFGASDWYKHRSFQPYWDHYEHVMGWCQKHYETCNKLSHIQNSSSFNSYPMYMSEMPNMFPHYKYQHGGSHTGSVTGSEKSLQRRRRRGGRKQKKRKHNFSCSDSVGTQTHSEFEMEITQDMIDFFAKSAQHRRLRDEAKKGGQGKTEPEPDHINVEQVSTMAEKTPTVEPPSERPGARRTAEMKLLYGRGAPMIHGMETALQMAFDRTADLMQPKMWPNMPLRVVFS